jgi:hypothetical protein
MNATVSNQYTVDFLKVLLAYASNNTIMSQAITMYHILATKQIQAIDIIAASIALIECTLLVISSSLNPGADPTKIIAAAAKKEVNCQGEPSDIVNHDGIRRQAIANIIKGNTILNQSFLALYK